jgi:hypothetical protein
LRCKPACARYADRLEDWASEVLFQHQMHGRITLLIEPRVGSTRSKSAWSLPVRERTQTGGKTQGQGKPSLKTAEKREFVGRMRFCRTKLKSVMMKLQRSKP